MPRPRIAWTDAKYDHLRWMCAVEPPLSVTRMANSLGCTTETFRIKVRVLGLAPRKKGRKYQAGVGRFNEESRSVVGEPIGETPEDRGLRSNSREGSDELLGRLREFHFIEDVVKQTLRIQA